MLKILLLVVIDLFDGVVVIGCVFVGGRGMLECCRGRVVIFFVIGDRGMNGIVLIDLFDFEFVFKS